jgi:glycosyltransferase involved in cell wall biosynthesis
LELILVASSGDIAGGERNLLDIGFHLKKEGWEVKAVIPHEGSIQASLESEGISFEVVPMPSYPTFSSLLKLKKIFKKFQPRIIHAHGTRAALFARLANVRKFPCIYTLHGIHYLHYSNAFKKWLYIWGERFLKPLTSRFICVSQYDFNEGKKFGVIDPKRTAVIYNGVRGFSLPSKEEARKEFTLNDEVVVLNIGRLHVQKGHTFLIEGAKKVLERKSNVKFWIVGEGEERGSLSEKIRKEGLQGKISLLGYREDVSKLLAAADIFILTSLWEGFPYTILEAMSAGLPVVSTDVGGVAEAVEHQQTGLLVPLKKPHLLANALIYLIEHPEERKRMGEKGKERVREKFSLEKMLSEIEKVYDEVLRAGNNF